MFGIKEGLYIAGTGMDSITGIFSSYVPQFAFPSIFSGHSVASGECKLECPAGFTARDNLVGYGGKCACAPDNTYQYDY